MAGEIGAIPREEDNSQKRDSSRENAGSRLGLAKAPPPDVRDGNLGLTRLHGRR